jgi:hypothetical protein
MFLSLYDAFTFSIFTTLLSGKMPAKTTYLASSGKGATIAGFALVP